MVNLYRFVFYIVFRTASYSIATLNAECRYECQEAVDVNDIVSEVGWQKMNGPVMNGLISSAMKFVVLQSIISTQIGIFLGNK